MNMGIREEIAKGKDIFFMLSNNDELQDRKGLIKNYKISNFDNKQLC